MRLPTRKSEKQNIQPVDLHITPEKFAELEVKLAQMKRARPRLAEEVRRLAELGDFSENVEYQIAKGKLRGLNRQIDETAYLINHAFIIKNSGREAVELGREVTVEVNGRRKIYRILGSAETDPARGIISHNSPIGAALLNRRAGESVAVRLKNGETVYKIIKIS
ncbi:transcription elongation factor GreA [Candidatus Falkowbacteria bacterium CG10_big_fil_rev_8_21_14_0_10_43_10]|uniref:Transcription elongation factor GreA n=1 Tax=Candidatus Falkowbacteria bacterium CG10_big_fil_rev_8_21_14_0_10_43_10 TaxID=1974567 RepID=A0A2H0V2K3_9BACT|nr:MAG: transcription elongation factor GreA [Candidatus Falkowbacteria bacterium CG10_big_fil_rev_8_21_14_0_10_43_10]